MNKIALLKPATPVRGSWLAVSLLAGVVAGCANPFDVSDDTQWHGARVLSVLKRADLDDSMNRRCVDGLDPKPEQVALVSVRIHRAPHVAAFAVPTSLGLKEKDRVSVNFRLCQLRPVAEQ